ncbi:MAG TPA: ATP-binding protein [Promineifilum sp.]|nr:ATP-binding protein [Promineifilum sp.]HRQ12805.1 ATP-binding protein [Promineifilum sp.]
MVFLQQIIELLSRPPGSVIYHLVTLFALQVVLALAFSRWQRDANDESARRMTFAAGGILVARLVLLFVGLMVEPNPAQARIVLPPMEQAIDMATVILMVWGLAPFAMSRPRLADGFLLISLVVVAVMFLFFFQDWQNRVTATGVATAYVGTIQAYVWGVLQMAILAMGLIWSLMERSSRLTLRPIIIAVVLLAHVANFFNYPEIIPSGTEIVYWLRLGYLVAFPLWAVQAYRDNIRGLLTPVEAERLQAAQLAHNLQLSTRVIGARLPEMRLEQALDMVTGLVPARLTAIGLIDEKNPQRVVFGHLRPTPARDTGYGRQINLSDHAAFRLAYEQQRGIELLPRGVGARQAHELSQQFNAGPFGPVFVEPLVVANHCLGFLMLAAPPTAPSWSERDRAIIPGMAAFIAQAIANSRHGDFEAAGVSSQAVSPVLPAAITLARAADRDTEKERLMLELAETRRMLSAAEERTRQAETMAVFLQQRDPGQPTAARPQVTQSALGPAAEYAAGAILPMLRQKNLKLDMAVDQDLPLAAVKETVLRQLVLSLLENSCRASRENGTIFVRADLISTNGGGPASGRAVALSVSDSGSGIRAEDRDRVFDSQYYLSGGRPIVGLGDNSANLAVVQKLAQASGGDLQFESKLGTGTTFTLRLPAAEVRPWTLMKVKQQMEASAPKRPAAEIEAAAGSTTVGEAG